MSSRVSALPKKISRYQIVSELGRGAMGVVYKATDPNIGRTVALKTMRMDVHGTDEEEILKRFKHEAKLAGVMNHPNIITIFDAGEFDGLFYIAMEYLEGVTLQSVLHEQRVLPTDQIITISKAVCAGLDYAHQRGVIHRDIKPANIMLGKDGVVEIMDFGIAKSGATMTTAGQVLGTPTYMSPEQVRGRDLDGRSDLFSWGVCLYEMVTGEKPFTGQNVTTIIYKIMNEAPIPPRDLDVSIHPGLSALIVKSLAKNPDERYQTGEDLVHDLVNYKSYGSTAPATREIAVEVAEQSLAAKAFAAAVTLTGFGSQPEVGEESATTTVPVSKDEAPKHEKTRPLKKMGSTVKVAARTQVAKVRAPRNRWIAWTAIAALFLAGIAVTTMAIMKRRVAATQAQQPAPPVQEAPSVVPSPVANDTPRKTTKSTTKKASTRPKPDSLLATSAAPALPTTAPASARPANTGSLRVTSEPAGAKVTISGISNPGWVTPFTVSELEPGVYELSIARAGFISRTDDVRVNAGEVEAFNINLSRAGAELNLNSNPPGAQIFVDGKSVNKITPATVWVAKGQHKVELRKQGYKDEGRSVNLKDGDSYNYSPELDVIKAAAKPKGALFGKLIPGNRPPRGKGVLMLRSSPSGADIFYNGQRMREQTPIRFPLDPGTYTIQLRKDGFKPTEREFAVAKGKVTELNIELEKR